MPYHIHQQTFQYDALGNITSCTTQFVEGGQNTATYTYDRSTGKDPCQLQSVAHTHADYPKQITLSYDACGRLQADEHSRTLTYDACGRLASIAASTSLPAASYQYDAFDRLVAQTIGADTTSLYYRASALVNQLTGADLSQHQRFIGGGIAQSTNETSPKTWLTGSDSQRNVLLAEQGETRETQTYSPYGYREPDAKAHSKLGYTGERRDPASGVYHLGNGYRSYNPTLMRFTAPDSWSPFGAGGINPYAYCAGDPINRADPSGHLSGWSWASIGIGVGLGILGVALAIPTGGASLSAVAVVEMGLGLSATGTGIAAAALEEKAPKASVVLGWATLALGIAGGVTGVIRGALRVAAGGSRLGAVSDIVSITSSETESEATSTPRILATFDMSPSLPRVARASTQSVEELEIAEQGSQAARSFKSEVTGGRPGSVSSNRPSNNARLVRPRRAISLDSDDAQLINTHKQDTLIKEPFSEKITARGRMSPSSRQWADIDAMINEEFKFLGNYESPKEYENPSLRRMSETESTRL